jgi:hypothetical protein
LSQNKNIEGILLDELTICKEVVPKGDIIWFGSIGSKFNLGILLARSCSFSSKETHLEQELIEWLKKVKEQKAVNEEQKLKLENQ